MNNENLKEHITILGLKLANAYRANFKEEVINHLYSKPVCLDETKIDITKFFDKEDWQYLDYKEKIKWMIDENTFVIFNLKGEISEYIIDNKKDTCSNFTIMQIIPVLVHKGKNIDLNHLIKKIRELYITSYIYNIAFQELCRTLNTSYPIVIAGMFRNAYFNILEFKNYNYVQEFLLENRQSLTK